MEDMALLEEPVLLEDMGLLEVMDLLEDMASLEELDYLEAMELLVLELVRCPTSPCQSLCRVRTGG